MYKVATRFFQIFSMFLKVCFFDSIFNLKLSLSLKTMLNSTKTLNGYCKATLDVSNRNFIAKHVKFVRIFKFF